MIHKKQEWLNNEKSFAELIPWRALVAPGLVICKDGHLMATLKLEGCAFETADDMDINLKCRALNAFYTSIAGDVMSLKFHRVRRYAMDRLSSPKEKGFAKDFIEDYNQSFMSTPFMVTELYVTLVMRHNKRPSKPPKPSKWINGILLEKKYEEHLAQLKTELDERIDCFEKTFRLLVNALADYGPRRLGEYEKDGEFFSELLGFLNYLLIGYWQPVRVPHCALQYALGNCHVFFSHDIIQFDTLSGSNFAQCIEVKDYQLEETNPALMDSLLYPLANGEGIYPFIETQTFCFLDKTQGISVLKLQRQRLQSTQDEGYHQIAQINDAIQSLQASHFAFGEYSYSLMVFGPTEELTRKFANDAAQKLQSQGLLPFYSTLALGYAYLHQLPGSLERPRVAKLTSINFSHLATLHNFPSGKRNFNPWGEAVALMRQPSGQPFYFNFHSTRVNEKCRPGQMYLGNTVILGTAGSGKTALLNFMLCSLQKFRTETDRLSIVYFDKDRGAELAIRALGGSYLRIENGQPTGMNPFQLPKTEENVQFLIRFTKKLVTYGKTPLTTNQETSLVQAVRAVMNMAPNIRRLSYVVQNMTEGTNEREKEDSVPKRLARWIGNGDLAWCFDNPVNEFDLNESPIFGIDGTDFLDNEEVCSLFTDLIFHMADTQVFLESGGPRGVLIMDAFWQYLKDPETAKYAFDKLKTIRKKNAFTVFATQSPKDILVSPDASNFVENCCTQIFLPNPRGDEKDYIDGFKLTQKEFLLMKNLGEHSRTMLVKQKNGSAICRLDLSPFPQALDVLSTSPERLRKMEEMIAKYGSNPDDWLPHFFAKDKSQ
ncbi:MAG: hypothetical protein LUC43_04645 [Burkholderiales bacterium]|nr:hypothetical protein [Burkholderiales bacterium]